MTTEPMPPYDAKYPEIRATSCRDAQLQAKITYNHSDHHLHLTLWDRDLCLDRVSVHLDKFFATLEIPVKRNFKLELEAEIDDFVDTSR